MFNGFALNNIQNAYVGSTPAQAIYLGSTLIWPTGHNYSRDYLTIVSLANNNIISWQSVESTYTKTISVSTDDGNTWTSYTSAPYTPTVLGTLNNGDKMLIKGNNTVYYDGQSYYSWFTTSDDYNIEGNIMSLIYEDNFINQTSFPNNSSNNFSELFWHSDKLISAENLILPATILTDACYAEMFVQCSSLTTPPELPATTLAEHCYSNMFRGCTSLTTAPELHATTLSNWCYAAMFMYCSSLTTAPELPATTLARDCYYEMFEYCTSLTIAPKLPATTLSTGCYDSMFNNCTSLTTAPELVATTLTMTCYQSMFFACSSLNYIKCLATDISATDATYSWVNSVASSGTFVKDANTTWPSGVSGIPSGWTVIDA